MLNELVRRGMLREGEAGWELPNGLEAVAAAVPNTLRQLINQQWEQLSSVEQQVLKAASVAGMEFAAATLAAVVEQSSEDVEAHCNALARGSSSSAR